MHVAGFPPPGLWYTSSVRSRERHHRLWKRRLRRNWAEMMLESSGGNGPRSVKSIRFDSIRKRRILFELSKVTASIYHSLSPVTTSPPFHSIHQYNTPTSKHYHSSNPPPKSNVAFQHHHHYLPWLLQLLTSPATLVKKVRVFPRFQKGWENPSKLIFSLQNASLNLP